MVVILLVSMRMHVVQSVGRLKACGLIEKEKTFGKTIGHFPYQIPLKLHTYQSLNLSRCYECKGGVSDSMNNMI